VIVEALQDAPAGAEPPAPKAVKTAKRARAASKKP
jgi:hypothetical protein